MNIKWLRNNAYFACAECSAQSNEPNCYPVAELRLYRGEPCCENCFDSADQEDGDPDHWSDLPAFDPFERERTFIEAATDVVSAFEQHGVGPEFPELQAAIERMQAALEGSV